MKLSEILKPANMKIPLLAVTKAGAIEELVNLLAANGDVTDAPRVLEAVMQREATRATGIGSGVGVPHGKSPGTPRLVVAFGKAATPLEFGAIDGRPVNFVWLLCSPVDQAGPHIIALSAVSKLMKDDRLRQQMASAPDAAAAYDMILKFESPR
jgi:mannitol/fructose-specific phosphotransferase system IIA component (Ntr-type)